MERARLMYDGRKECVYASSTRRSQSGRIHAHVGHRGLFLVVPVKQARLLEWRGGSVTKSPAVLLVSLCIPLRHLTDVVATGAVSLPLSIPSS